MPVLLPVLLVLVAVLLVGGLIAGLAMKVVWWLVLGLVIGALARLVLPGRQPIGVLATAAGGIVGSLSGGLIADAIGVGAILQFGLAVLVAALVVAVLSARVKRDAPVGGRAVVPR
jgi:uncharacterized membrane protein YeaQ/YmgE (transglycosylase-associated protein family)